MEPLFTKAKELLEKRIADFGSNPYQLTFHIPEVERWSKFLLKYHSEADAEVVILGALLHDIGHYPLPTDIDHAVRGEQIAREFLVTEKFDEQKIEKVLHCVRAHRCNDVQPETIEAKIVAVADSASHFTDSNLYLMMVRKDIEKGGEQRVFSKLERDFRDVGIFPELKKELTPLYEAWKVLLKEYEKACKELIKE